MKTDRNTHDGMPELLAAFERDEHFFVVVEVTIDTEARRFQFGVSRKSYIAVKRILQTRVFDMMPGLRYRYFLSGTCRPIGLLTDKIGVRIEQGQDATSKEFEVPKELHSNLLWFKQLESFDDAKYLEITLSQNPE